MDLSEHREMIAAVCRELGLERLDVFGSATRADFAAKSDVDVLVQFDGGPGEMFRRYFDLKERLQRRFNRPVDLVLEDSVKNPYFREAIERSRVNVYGH